MYRIIDNRGSGKTNKLMLLAKETQATIACMNPSAMYQKATAYGITGVSFIHYNDLLAEKRNGYTNIMIDEMENFVKYCIGNTKLTGYSLTNED